MDMEQVLDTSGLYGARGSKRLSFTSRGSLDRPPELAGVSVSAKVMDRADRHPHYLPQPKRAGYRITEDVPCQEPRERRKREGRSMRPPGLRKKPSQEFRGLRLQDNLTCLPRTWMCLEMGLKSPDWQGCKT